MKYFNTLIEEQETLINVLYDEQIVSIYTNRIDVIQNLTDKIGKPTKKYVKSKTYWSGASWDVCFSELNKLEGILNKELFIEKEFKTENKKKKKIKGKDNFKQESFL